MTQNRIPLPDYRLYSPEDMRQRAAAFCVDLHRRRSVRDFSSRPVERAIIESCIAAAGSAPSGANQQPWQFVAVSDPAVKQRIREAAEKEERAFYEKQAPQKWLDDLTPLGTDHCKPFLEDAPWLIAVFVERYGFDPQGDKTQHYYATKSVGIATGFLISALHNAGLVSLTYTPSAMGFLRVMLDRPANESPFLVLVVGHPAEKATVPAIERKSLGEICTFI